MKESNLPQVIADLVRDWKPVAPFMELEKDGLGPALLERLLYGESAKSISNHYKAKKHALSRITIQRFRDKYAPLILPIREQMLRLRKETSDLKPTEVVIDEEVLEPTADLAKGVSDEVLRLKKIRRVGTSEALVDTERSDLMGKYEKGERVIINAGSLGQPLPQHQPQKVRTRGLDRKLGGERDAAKAKLEQDYRSRMAPLQKDSPAVEVTSKKGI